MAFFRIFSFSKKKPLRVNTTAKSSGQFQAADFIYNFLTLLYQYREKPRCTSTTGLTNQIQPILLSFSVKGFWSLPDVSCAMRSRSASVRSGKNVPC